MQNPTAFWVRHLFDVVRELRHRIETPFFSGKKRCLNWWRGELGERSSTQTKRFSASSQGINLLTSTKLNPESAPRSVCPPFWALSLQTPRNAVQRKGSESASVSLGELKWESCRMVCPYTYACWFCSVQRVKSTCRALVNRSAWWEIIYLHISLV